MAGNVFGNPVTDAVVRFVHPQVNEITPLLRAQVAMQYMNAEGREVNCKNFVENLKERYDNGISALSMIFNATGSTLTFVGHNDWHGHIYESPYPLIIQNGQWGGFLHIHPSKNAASESAVVYRGEDSTGCASDWMLAWSIPSDGDNHVYTEIREAHHYESDHWAYIRGLMIKKPTYHTDSWNGCYSAVTIGQGTSPEFVGIMTLDGTLSFRSAAI